MFVQSLTEPPKGMSDSFGWNSFRSVWQHCLLLIRCLAALYVFEKMGLKILLRLSPSLSRLSLSLPLCGTLLLG